MHAVPPGGVLRRMTSQPNQPDPTQPDRDHEHPQPASDEADRDKETTPAGVAGDLEEMAEDTGATTTPTDPAR
jgi:hypothetical protein